MYALDFILSAYSKTPHESTGLRPNRFVYGAEMLLSLNILTESLSEHSDKDGNMSEYASNHIRSN